MDERPFDRLTDRQKACLRLVRDGFTSKEIAARIQATPDTVDKNIKGAMAKLGIDRRTVAARMLCQHEQQTGVQQMAPQRPDLPFPGDRGTVGSSPDISAIPPAVREERAMFKPVLDAPSTHPPIARMESGVASNVSNTIGRIFDHASRLAGIILMIMALGYIVSVMINRWEATHHVRPR